MRSDFGPIAFRKYYDEGAHIVGNQSVLTKIVILMVIFLSYTPISIIPKTLGAIQKN